MKKWRSLSSWEQTWLGWRLREFYYNTRNRYIHKYYLLDIKAIKRHEYCDSDYKMFHAVFQILVDFVEKELGNGEKEGLANLDAQIALNDPTNVEYAYYEEEDGTKTPVAVGQAEAAKKAKELYLWYKYERPARPDPYDMPDEPQCVIDGRARTHVRDENGNSIFNSQYTEEEREEVHRYYMEIHGLEEDYEEEDTSRAQQLLAIRRFLWT